MASGRSIKNGVGEEKKMKYIAIIAVALTVSGCGWFDRYVVANVSGWSRACVEGVSYLQFPSGVTVEYTREGKIKTCG